MEKAWLIYWDWAGDAASKRDKVVGVLPASTHVDEVARHLERLYALDGYNLQEIVAAANGSNPYEAQISNRDNPNRLRIICGHNPYLVATLAEDVEVTSEGDFGVETISWTETFPSGVVGQQSYTRTKTGPISLEEAWDRAKNQFKDFSD